MNKLFFFLSIVFLSVALLAQNSADTLNQLDSNGKKHGYWKKYDLDTLRYEGHFEHGIPEGEFIYYYHDGNVKTKMTYSNNGQDAYSIMYFNTGKKMAEGKFINKKRDGEWITYDGFDHEIAKVNYVSGKKSGLATYYFPEGGKLEEINYVDGVEDGMYTQYFANSGIKMRGSYENGKFQGIFAFYYPNNVLYNTGSYEKGLRHGVWTMYDDEGEIIVKVTYNHGDVVKREVFQEDKDPEAINKKLGDEEHKKKGTTSTDNGINDPKYDGY